MKKRTIATCLLLLLFGLTTFSAQAQDWEWTTYESEQFDLQFDLPAHWTAEADDETLVATGDGIVFVITAVRDASVSTEGLFAIQVETLGLDAEGEYEEVELQGGILGIIGGGAAVVEDEVVGLILLAATLDENNYLAYIFADPETFDYNEDTMSEIILSLAPLGWIDE